MIFHSIFPTICSNECICSSVSDLLKEYDIDSVSQGDNNNDDESEGTWRFRRFYDRACIWYFSEERVEKIDNVDDSEFIQGKEEQIQSEFENDGKEFDKHRIKI